MRVRRLTTMRRDGDASVARYPLKAQKVLKYKKSNKPRDVAQLVARLLWEQDVAGSNPVIPTIKGCLSHSDQASFSFQVRFQYLVCCRKPNIVSPLANVPFRPRTPNRSFGDGVLFLTGFEVGAVVNTRFTALTLVRFYAIIKSPINKNLMKRIRRYEEIQI